MAQIFVTSAKPKQTISGVVQAQPTQTILPPKPSLTYYKYSDNPTVYDNTGKAYSSEQEFKNSGGSFDKVQVRTRPLPILTPTAISTPASTLKPAMSFPVTPQAIPQATQIATQEAQFRQQNPSPLSMNQTAPAELASMARAPFRAALAVDASIANNPNPIQATTGLQRFFVGDEEVTPIARSTADLELALKDKGFGKGALPAALAFTVLSTTADLYPGAGGENKLIKEASGLFSKQLLEGVAKDEVLNNIYKKFGAKIGQQFEKEVLPKITEQVMKSDGSLLAKTVTNAGREVNVPVKPKEFNPLPSLTKTEKLKEATQGLRTEFTDRLAPLKDLTDKKVLPDKDPYIQARLYAGHLGKVQNRLENLGDILKTQKADIPVMKKYAQFEREMELAGRGITKFEDGRTAQQVAEGFDKLKAELGPEQSQKVAKFAEDFRKYQSDLFDEFHAAGGISDEGYAAVKQANEKYISMQRMEYIAEQGDNIQRGANSFSVSSQNIARPIKGSTKKIVDPIESAIRNTYKIQSFIERNKVAQKLGDLANDPQFKDIVIPLRTAEKVTERINLLTEAKKLNQELKPLLRNLRSTFAKDNKTLSQIHTLETTIKNLSEERATEAFRFFNKGTPMGKTVAERRSLGTLPDRLQIIAAKAKDYKSFAALDKTKLGVELEKLELDGVLERAGFSSREKFFEQIKSPYGFTPAKTVEDKGKGALQKLIKAQKEIESLSEKLGLTKDINKSSVNDSLIFLEKAINDIRFNKEDIFAKLPELADKEVPLGMEKISVFRKGIKEEYAVPKAVGEAMKGMNTQESDLVTKWARFSSGLLRSGATSLNLAFLPSNIVRDFQSATLVSKVGFTPLDWARGFAEAISKGKDYKAFLESGAGFSGFFEGNKGLTKTVGKLTESKLSKTVKTIINPFELIRKGAEITELAPRLGVFKRGLRKGLSTTEAGFNARNATVDFAKSGNTMRVINQWVPFLNARLQGTINTFGAIKNKPVSSAMKLTALVGLPVTATYLHNTRKHPEVWADIPQYEKDNNYLIIYGDKKDEDGRYTQVIKIPKADVGRIFGNIQENFLAYLDKADRKSLDELALQIASDASPISFERDGKFSPGTALSGTLPPTVKAGIEGMTNTNLFTGLPIVPDSMKDASPRQQYKETTAPAAKFVGDKLNVSPLKIENAVGTQFGGLGRQLIDLKRAPGTIVGRFSGSKGGQQEKEVQKEAEQFLREQTDEKLILNRKAQAKLKEINASSDPVKAFTELKQQDKKLAEKVGMFKKYEKQGWGSADFIISDLQVENGARAKFMVTQFNKLSTKEEKAALWADYVKKGHMSKNVSTQVKYLLNNPE